MNPIIGVRYKCAVSEDFDFCEKCEARIDHPYPFLKIKTPEQRPKKIICILRENQKCEFKERKNKCPKHLFKALDVDVGKMKNIKSTFKKVFKGMRKGGNENKE